MTIPTLTPRAMREQRTFRALLNAMARPGTVLSLPGVEGASSLLPVAEALVDHEVTFAAVPDHPEITDAVLRQTGSRVAAPEEADYVFCRADSLAEALSRCKDGTPEYPDASATVVCAVGAISEAPSSSVVETSSDDMVSLSDCEALPLSGPGIRDQAFVRIEGWTQAAGQAFREKNAAPPLGVDLVLVSSAGQVVCLSRYTRLQVED